MLKAYRIKLMFALSTEYCHITLMSEIYQKDTARCTRLFKKEICFSLKGIRAWDGGLAKLSLSSVDGQKVSDLSSFFVQPDSISRKSFLDWIVNCTIRIDFKEASFEFFPPRLETKQQQQQKRPRFKFKNFFFVHSSDQFSPFSPLNIRNRNRETFETYIYWKQ